MISKLLDRSIVFSFDKTGFNRHAKGFTARDLDVDLAGKVCLVTGASSGLGVAVVEGLVSRGARVYMLCRNAAKAERVRTALCAPDLARVEQVDVSDFDSIRSLAERFEERIDVLVHNAGALFDARETSAQGLELTNATNYLGPLLLTKLLWPRLAPDARLIHVSSGGMYSQTLDVARLFDPPAPFDGVEAYAQTKRAQVVISELLAERTSRAVSSMHPGWADTPGVQQSLPRFHALTKRILRSPEQGADTIVWLAASPAASDPGGRLFFDREARPTHLSTKTREDRRERDRLWLESCRAIGADPEEDFR